MSGLCGIHRRQWQGWLNYREPITGWVQFPVSVERSSESRAAKVDERLKLIRDQVTAIFTLCAEGRGCGNAEPWSVWD